MRLFGNWFLQFRGSGSVLVIGPCSADREDAVLEYCCRLAAQHEHMFIYRGWEVTTTGNELAHAILRGYVNKDGQAIPNYHFEDLEALYNAYMARNLKHTALIVDVNHANSAKNYQDQPRICAEVLHSCRISGDIRSMVKGFMIESYLEEGSQKIGEGVFGKSITDPCIGWQTTKRLVLDIAEQI